MELLGVWAVASGTINLPSSVLLSADGFDFPALLAQQACLESCPVVTLLHSELDFVF